MRIRSCPALKRLLNTILYIGYVSVFVAVSLEIICRLGLLPNNRYAMNSNLNQRKGKVNIVVLGDSFSLETPVSASTLLRRHLAGSDVATLNLAQGGMGPKNYLSQLRSYGL